MTNREACLRLVMALCIERSEEWLPGRRYLDMTHLQAEAAVEADEEEVATMARLILKTREGSHRRRWT